MTTPWWRRAGLAIALIALTATLYVMIAVPLIDPMIERMHERVLAEAPPEAASVPDTLFRIGIYTLGYGGFLVGAGAALGVLVWMFGRRRER